MKVLPKPDGWGNTQESYTALRNDVARRIQKVWQEIFGIEM